MPIWTFDLPDDVQPNLVLDLSTLSVVTAPGVSSTITVEADEILEPLLDVTAMGPADISGSGHGAARYAPGCPPRCRIDQR